MEKKLHLVRNTMEKGAEVSAKYITKKCNFYPLYFAKNAFFLYVFCRNLYAFSVAFCPKCNFWPLYLAQNAFFWYVFCRNPYSFLHCRLPQMPFFLLYFSKTTILFSCDGLSWSFLFFKRGLEYIFILRFGHCILILDCRKILWIVKTSYGLNTPWFREALFIASSYYCFQKISACSLWKAQCRSTWPVREKHCQKRLCHAKRVDLGG